MFDIMQDQDRQISRLCQMVVSDTVPHALLFTGIDGIGKSSVAKAFAMMLNCRERVNQNRTVVFNTDCPCRSCSKIRSDSHPDLLALEPSGNVIKIGQIRELCRKLLVKPTEAKIRLVIIYGAHLMNPEAGNALLKSLEEPPDNTMFILISNQASDILPTLLSRCQHVGFNPVSTERIRKMLVNKYNLDRNEAELYASLSGGSPGKALELALKPGGQTMSAGFRHFLFDELAGFKKKSISDLFLFSEKLAQKKEKAMEALDILLSFIRDLTVIRFTPHRVTNLDMIQKMIELSNLFTIKALSEMTEHIMAARKAIQSNVSLRLALDVMAINVKRV